MRRYETFLIRHWWLDEGGERVEVTHVPTGAHALLLSLAQAVAWMSAQVTPPADEAVAVESAASQRAGEG